MMRQTDQMPWPGRMEPILELKVSDVPLGSIRRVTGYFNIETLPAGTEALYWRICDDLSSSPQLFSLRRRRMLLPHQLVLPEIADGDRTSVVLGRCFCLCSGNRQTPRESKLSLFACVKGGVGLNQSPSFLF